MIILKSPAEIEKIRAAGRIVAMALKLVEKEIRAGVTTKALDELIEDFILKHGARPSFKGYGGFPASACISVNEELVHGIPGKRRLKEGDVVTIDVGAEVDGYHADSAWTFGVGKISEEDARLLRVTEEALYKGLEQAMPNRRLSDISHAVQTHVEKHGYSVVREYVGHGVGQNLHEDPQIPNYGPPNRGPRLKPGMVLAIEPMVIAGERYVRTLADNWTVVSEDKSNCAHFEHTIVITDTGHEILTKV